MLMGRKRRKGGITETQFWNILGLSTFSAVFYWVCTGVPMLFINPAAFLALVVWTENMKRKHKKEDRGNKRRRR